MKHNDIYHGNFIPQIPNQLIRRYTKENEVVLELDFMTDNKTLIEVKYKSIPNEKQQKLFNETEADKKIVVDGHRAFLDMN